MVVADSLRLKRYQRMVEIARDLASTLELNELLQRIVQAAAELSESQAASILLYDELSQEISFQVATNMEEPLVRGLSVPLEGSIAGWTVIHRQTAIVADPHSDPRFFDQVEKTTEFPTRSIVALPLITKDKVVGVLEVLNKEVGQYSEDDREVLEALAAQAAVAIENTRMFQQSDLIADLVHEIRTPLTALDTAAYLLDRPEITPEQRSSLSATVHNETQRLNELATSFLDLARLESGRVGFKLGQVDLPLLLEECLRIVEPRADQEDVGLLLEIDHPLPKLNGDADKLKQMLLNLLSNAIKFNRPGGSVTLAATPIDNEIVVEVRDTGYGIPEESLPHLFEKFYRAPGNENLASGTGLGLAISRHIIESHHGRIQVESELGAGSVFRVFLPHQN